MKVLEAKNIRISFSGKDVLKNVNIEINERETVVFIGPSGSGKSVLIKALAGVLTPAEGQVFIEGENWLDLESEDKHKLAKKLGMLFQYGALFDEMTALENVKFPLIEHHFLEGEELEAHSLSLLKQVNLLEAKDKIPSELSGGMQRRLGIARALALNPRIIFYDDPVAGQDPIQSDQMLNLIKDFKKKNDSTAVIVTSNMRVALKMADRIFMVIDGGVFETGSPEETKAHSDPRVQQFINGQVEGPIKVK